MASRSAFAMYVPTVDIPVASIPSKSFNGQTGQALAATTSGLLDQLEAGVQARADTWAGKAVTGLGAAMAARVQETEASGVPEGFTQSLQEDFKRQVEALRKEMPPYARNTFELGARNVWNRVTAYTLPAEEAAKAARHTATVHEAIDNLSAAAAQGIGDLPSLLRESGAIIGGAKLPEAERHAAIARAHGRIAPLYIMGLARRGGFEHAFQVLDDGALEKRGIDPRVINSIREVLKAEQRRQKRAKSAVRSVALVRGLSEGLRRAAAVRDGHATMFDLPDVEAFEAEFGRAASRTLRQAVEETVREVEDRSKAIDEVAKRVARGERIEPKDADGFDFFWSEHLAPQVETLPEDARRRFVVDAVKRAGRVPHALKRDIIAAFKSGDHAAIAGNVELLDAFSDGAEIHADFLDGPEREVFEGVSALYRAGHTIDGAVKRVMEGLDLTSEKREARGRTFDRLMRRPGALETLKDDLFNALRLDRPGGLELDESETRARGQTLEYVPERDGSGPAVPLGGAQHPSGGPAGQFGSVDLGEGGESATDGIRIKPRPGGGFSPSPLPEQPKPGYEYGAWRQKYDAWRQGLGPAPVTEGGSTIVDRSALTQAQQDRLNYRRWVHPTGKRAGAVLLEKGFGFFGAQRNATGRPQATKFHGGYDAPFRYPNDPASVGSDRGVVLPTDAQFVGFAEKDASGAVINKLTFYLGDGLYVELLHVTPNARLMKLINGNRFGGALAAGEALGDIDATHDHTHLQILVTQPNGDRWAIDPTPYMEPDPMEFLQRFFNNSVDDAREWVRRQFE